MSRFFRSALVLFSVVVLLGIPSLFALRIYTERASQQTAAEAHFSDIRDSITGWAASTAGGTRPASSLADELRPLLTQNESLNVLIVYRLHDNLEYAWSRNPQTAAQIDELLPAPANDATRVTFWQQELSETIGVNGSGLVIGSVYQLLFPETVFQNIRDALLSIIAFALLLIVALIAGISGAAPVAAGSAQPVSPAGSAQPVSTERAVPSESNVKRMEEPGSPTSMPLDPAPPDSNASQPPPLVSTETGLSFSSHLNRRLDLELQRAAENELDVTVLYATVIDTSTGRTPPPDVFGHMVLEFFPFEDLVFDLRDQQEGLCCIILPGVDLPGALRKAQRFVTLGRRHEGYVFTHRLGASSRNGRLVESNRLLREAREALKKTDERAPVIGFLPDPDRYRSAIRGDGETFTLQ